MKFEKIDENIFFDLVDKNIHGETCCNYITIVWAFRRTRVHIRLTLFTHAQGITQCDYNKTSW